MKNFKNIFKTKTLITTLALVAMCVLSVNAFFASEPAAFKDVPASHWGFTSIQRAYTDGAVSGSSYNEATGERFYSPEAKLTVAEFVTILTRAFYADDLAASTATGQWYAAAQDVANKHNLMKDLGTVDYNAAASRYQMAMIMENIMADLGADMPTPDELVPLISKIPDWNQMPSYYQDAVATVFHMGLITGKDDKGTFAGNDGVTRAEAATIYCRLADAIGSISTQKPVTPVTPTTPEQPETPTTPVTPVTPEKPVEKPTNGNYGPVGTLSDTPVTLSLSTHAPVVDYWSKAPADVQAITDKNVFNAAVQTMKDKDLQVFDGSGLLKNNEYYNYAVFEYDMDDQKKMNVIQAAGKLTSTYGGYSSVRGFKNTDAPNISALTYSQNASLTAQLDEVFNPIFAQFRSGMSDKQKAEIMLKAITDRFSYDATTNEMFTWLSDNKSGACGSYSGAVQCIFSAAGIPTYSVGGTVNNGITTGNHGWNYAYLDGEWWIVDATCAEFGYDGVMTVATHMDIYNYTSDGGAGGIFQVTRALIDAVYNQ